MQQSHQLHEREVDEAAAARLSQAVEFAASDSPIKRKAGIGYLRGALAAGRLQPADKAMAEALVDVELDEVLEVTSSRTDAEVVQLSTVEDSADASADPDTSSEVTG